jgi:hypothetical protein
MCESRFLPRHHPKDVDPNFRVQAAGRHAWSRRAGNAEAEQEGRKKGRQEMRGMESSELGEEIVGLPRGHLARFTASLTPEQKKLWAPIQRAWRADKRRAEDARPTGSNRDLLYASMNQAQGKITAEKIERLIDNAVAKGDVQALRVMAQMAGMDLTDRPKQAVGEGAKVIVIRPHPMLLTPEEEAGVQEQIAAAEDG